MLERNNYVDEEKIMLNKNYQIPEKIVLEEQLNLIDKFKQEIETEKKNKPELWNIIQQKLKMSWTYNSNAIEGSTLSEGDTIFFLQYGLTVAGKPLKDFLYAKNHSEAIDILNDVVTNNREISEGLIKEFNALLLDGIKNTKAINQFGQSIQKPANPGEYKKNPNHVLQLDGTIHHYIEPIQVQIEMEMLINWINQNKDKIHPVIVGAIAHYNMVRIHPFDDGNGRGSRILMNLILMNSKFPPAIIRNEKRRDYINCLMKADSGDLIPFINFVIESLTDTQKIVLDELKKNSS